MTHFQPTKDFRFCGISLSVVSRSQLVKLSHEGFDENTYVISVVDTDACPARLKTRPSGVLRLTFDDTEIEAASVAYSSLEDEADDPSKPYNSIFAPISEDDARMIVDFVESNKTKMNHLICSCEVGQSRSAAIAAAIMEHYTGEPSPIFEDIRFHPNQLVYDKIRTAWMQDG